MKTMRWLGACSGLLLLVSLWTVGCSNPVTQEVAKEVNKEATKEVAKEVAKEVVAETTKEATKEVSKEVAKEVVAETTKEVVNDSDAGNLPEAFPDSFIIPKKLSFHVNLFEIEENSKNGFDLNGDKVVDNRLGEILSSVTLKSLLASNKIDINNEFKQQITKKTLILLIEVENLVKPFTANGTADVSIYLGTVGASASEFKVSPESVDSQGNAKIRYTNVRVSYGTFYTDEGNFSFKASLVPGEAAKLIDLRKTLIRFRITQDLKTIEDGLLGGSITPATLDRFNAAKSLGGASILELLLTLLPSTAQPDIDVDQDGLETIVNQGSAGLKCTDGDGKTDLTTPSPCPDGSAKCSCVHNLKFPDGYSTAIKFTAKETIIVK